MENYPKYVKSICIYLFESILFQMPSNMGLTQHIDRNGTEDGTQWDSNTKSEINIKTTVQLY